MTPPDTSKVIIHVDPKVTKGFGTWLGVASSIVGYGGSVLTFLTATDQEAALAPFAAATLVLYKVLAGRFQQADSAIKATQSSIQPNTDKTPTLGVALARALPGELVSVSLDPWAITEATTRKLTKEQTP